MATFSQHILSKTIAAHGKMHLTPTQKHPISKQVINRVVQLAKSGGNLYVMQSVKREVADSLQEIRPLAGLAVSSRLQRFGQSDENTRVARARRPIIRPVDPDIVQLGLALRSACGIFFGGVLNRVRTHQCFEISMQRPQYRMVSVRMQNLKPLGCLGVSRGNAESQFASTFATVANVAFCERNRRRRRCRKPKICQYDTQINETGSLRQTSEACITWWGRKVKCKSSEARCKITFTYDILFSVVGQGGKCVTRPLTPEKEPATQP